MLEQQLTALRIFKMKLNKFLLNKEEITGKTFIKGNPLPGHVLAPAPWGMGNTHRAVLQQRGVNLGHGEGLPRR